MIIFFEESSSDRNVQTALRAARRLRRVLREADKVRRVARPAPIYDRTS